MEALSLVIYHNDPGTAQTLVVSLSQHFVSVNVARRYEELRTAIRGNRADVLVLDMEESQPDEIRHLHREFPSLCIVGTHRLADEELWTQALDQGAADVCEPRHDEVVRSVMRERERTHHAAA